MLMRKNREAKKVSSYKGGLLRVGLTFKTSLGSKRGFLIKFHPIFQRLVTTGCLTLSLKREEVLSHQPRSQLVESVTRSIMVIALLGWTFAVVVERLETMLGISLI